MAQQFAAARQSAAVVASMVARFVAVADSMVADPTAVAVDKFRKSNRERTPPGSHRLHLPQRGLVVRPASPFFLFYLLDFLRGTFAPFLRASDKPIAIACLRLLTVPPFPARPDFRVPCFLRRIALRTLFCDALPYRGMNSSCQQLVSRCIHNRYGFGCKFWSQAL